MKCESVKYLGVRSSPSTEAAEEEEVLPADSWSHRPHHPHHHHRRFNEEIRAATVRRNIHNRPQPVHPTHLEILVRLLENSHNSMHNKPHIYAEAAFFSNMVYFRHTNCRFHCEIHMACMIS